MKITEQKGGDQMQLRVDEGKWHFVKGAWSQGDDGIISAPTNLGDPNLAICTERVYGDFEAEFDFVWDTVWTNAGFVFRAQDARHYYMVNFPMVDEDYCAADFCAMVSIVKSTGWARVLDMKIVHGISRVSTAWNTVKVKVVGNLVEVWVDGEPVLTVYDDTYPELGYVGLGTYSRLGTGAKSRFRNFRILGETV